MTIEAAKEHNYIDHADEEKIIESIAIFESSGMGENTFYDEQVLGMARERSKQYLSDGSAVHSVKEFMEQIRQRRKKNGV